jgi:hypothetical protein
MMFVDREMCSLSCMLYGMSNEFHTLKTNCGFRCFAYFPNHVRKKQMRAVMKSIHQNRRYCFFSWKNRIQPFKGLTIVTKSWTLLCIGYHMLSVVKYVVVCCNELCPFVRLL